MYKSYILTDCVQVPCPYLEQTVDGRGGALTQQTHPLFEQRLVIQLTRTLTRGGGKTVPSKMLLRNNWANMCA